MERKNLMSKHNKTKQELILELEELKQKYDSLERVYLSDIESHKKIDKEFFHQQAEELLSKKTEDSGFKIPESDILKLNHELQTHQVELELQNEELLRVTSSLQQNESQYKSLFANNHSVMLLIDPETGEIKDANVAACFYYGWSHGELCKKNISDINTLSSDELAKELQRAKAEKRKHFFFKHCLANGEVRDVEIYSGPIHYGGTTLLYSLVHDITDRKIAEEKLHESEEKYSKAFQTSPYAIGITRLSDGKFLEVNDAFTTISGYSREEILANTVGPDFWVNPEDRNEMTKLLAEGNEVSGKEYQFRNKSGGIITGIFSAQIISLENEPYMLSSINDISAHKMAEDAQHESNALYKAIIHASPDNITITDLEGKVLFSSPKALEMFGFENMDQLINHHLIEFIVPEDRERAQSEIIKMHQGNDSGAASYRAKKADDTIIDIDVNGEFIRDENGTPTRMIFIVRDITERKKTEKALQLSEEKYRSIFETMLDVYYEAGLDGKVIDISPSIEIISKGQYTRNELIGKQIAEVYSDFEDQEAFLSEISKSGKVIDYELLLKNKDGLNIQVSISAGLILDKKGHPVKIAGTMRDITERKQTQEALIKNKIRLQQMAEQSGTVIWEIDSTGMYTYVSPVSKQVWDYSPEELVGKKHFYDLHPKEGREEFKLIALQAISKKEIFKEFPNQVLTKSNKLIWGSTNGVPILDHEGNLIGYRGADYDITDRKLAENALNDKNNLLTNLIVNMQEGILLEDADRKIALTNQLFCNMFSIPAPPEVMIGADCTSSAEESKHFFKNPDKFIADINLILTNKKAVFNDALELVDGRHFQRDYIPTYLENQYSGHLWKYRDITELKNAEASLKKLSHAIEQSPVMTYITGISGMIEYVNPKMLEITGYSEKELLGQNPRIFGSGERPKEEYKELWQTITSGKEWKGEFHNKKKNRELYWVSSSISAVSDDSGNITHFMAIQEDITNRKQSEKEILELNASLEQKVKDRTAEFKEALNRLNKIANLLPGMVYQYLLRPDGTSCFPYSSEGINDIYRVNPQEVADDASPVFANLHPDDFDGVVESIQASASNLEVWKDEYRVKFDDGTIRWLFGNATPQKEADGSILWHGFITDVTERKQVEEELAVEKQRLASILEGTNVGTWEWNVQTGSTTFNERWADIIGYTLEEISPVSIETWIKFAHPDDLKVSGELLEQHFKGELDYYSFESRMKHKDGSWIWILDRGKVHEWDADGKPMLMSGTHQDITTRKQAEAEIEESKERHRGLSEAAFDSIFFSEKGICVEQNLMAEKVFGYTTEEAIGRYGTDWIIPEHRKIVMDNMMAGAEEPYEVTALRKDGTTFPCMLSGKMMNYKGRNVRVTSLNDITELKLAEEELKWNQSLLNYMSNSSPLGLLVVDNRNDDILYFNHCFCEIWEIQAIEEQMQRGEFKNNDIIPYCLPVLTDVPAFAESCEPLQYEDNRIVLEDEISFTENRTVRRFSTQIRGENDEYYGRFYIFENISERKLAEAEILKAKNEAENANRAKSEFLSRMSHELRTPLNSILGFAQLMEMSDLIPSHKKRLNHILSNGKHLLKLINEVLDIAGIESGKQMMNIEPVLLIDMINQAMDVIQGAAHKRGVTIELVDAPSNNFFVMADKLRLKQVLLNLMSNAVKYNDEKGLVKIKTELQPLDASGNAMVRLSISDTGIGINPDNISKLFQSFERIGADKTEIEGTGLGLMLVRKFAEAMGGAVGVESKPDVGSTFWVDLPQTENKDNVKIKIEGVEEGAAIQEDAKVATILYIEDNLSNIELVEEILADHRPSIQLVTSIYGGKTIKLAKEYLPKLILLDLNLPDMKGDEVLKKLLADSVTKTIPVIMVSANAIPSQIKKLMKIGAVNYLTKPLDIIQFLKNVDQYTEI